MRIGGYFVLWIFMACNYPPSAPSPSTSNDNAYAQLFKFNVLNQDTSLDIFWNGDTLHFQKKLNPSFLLGSTTQWGYFDVLDIEKQIHGMTFPSSIQDTSFQQNLVRTGWVEDLQINGAEMNWEWIMLHPTDFFLYSPFDQNPCQNIPSTTISCLPFCDYLEPHPLGRLEWIKVIGWLNGKYPQSCAYFDLQKKMYESLISHPKDEKVLVGSLDGEQFWMNSSKSHMHQIIKDSGHETPYPSQDGNVPLDREQIWAILSEVKHVVLMGTQAQFARDVQKMQEWQSQFGTIGYYIFTDSTAYFEKGPVQPAQLLKNFIELPHPQAGFIQKITH